MIRKRRAPLTLRMRGRKKYDELQLMKKQHRFTPFQIIVFGFLAVILTGTLLLMLPVSSADGKSAGFFDALFTATSATCVTGLVVRDTATSWTIAGKIIILCLIQIGGMGVITVSVLFSMLLKKKLSIRQREVLQESISGSAIGGVVRETSLIVKIICGIELGGALCLFPVFLKDYPLPKAAGMSLFHSISAFCNAGFDLMGEKEAFSSLTSMAENIPVNLVLCLLILLGGIGFRTWDDFRKYRFHMKKYCMQSKLILSVSLVLILFPFIYFMAAEFSDLKPADRILPSLFQTVTTRTAGFNTVDLSKLKDASVILMIMLMMVGGASGSTAGGMKLNTLAVLMIALFSIFRQKKNAEAFGRRISQDAVLKAAAVLILYLSAFLFASMAISLLEGVPARECMFEAASAIATVGLSMGLTPTLGAVSRAILIVMMFVGRVGGLTFVYAMLKDDKDGSGKYPEETVSVG